MGEMCLTTARQTRLTRARRPLAPGLRRLSKGLTPWTRLGGSERWGAAEGGGTGRKDLLG